jgi:hypothetical protein
LISEKLLLRKKFRSEVIIMFLSILKNNEFNRYSFPFQMQAHIIFLIAVKIVPVEKKPFSLLNSKDYSIATCSAMEMRCPLADVDQNI